MKYFVNGPQTKINLILLVFLILLPRLSAREIVVNPGDDLNTIIKSAAGGDVLLVSPGEYGSIRLENLTFIKQFPLIVKKHGDGAAVIQGKGTSGSSAAVIKKCSYIVFDGIHFRGGLEACHVTTCNHMIFTHCSFSDVGQTAAKVEYRSSYVDFLYCDFYNTGLHKSGYGEGIYVGRGGGHNASNWPDLTEHVWIENCQFHQCGNGEGINVKGNTFYTTIKNCTVYDIELGVDYQHNEAGISLDHRAELNGEKYKPDLWRENWVEGNTVYNMRTGKKHCGDGIYSAGTGNYIINNTVYECEGHGIQLSTWGGDDLKAYVFNNNCYDNGKADKSYSSQGIEEDPGQNPNSAQTWYTRDTLVTRENSSPMKFQLLQNYPNPFNPSTVLRFSLTEPSPVVLTVYDVNGRIVDRMNKDNLAPGIHEMLWQPENLVSAVYICEIRSGGRSDVKRITLQK